MDNSHQPRLLLGGALVLALVVSLTAAFASMATRTHAAGDCTVDPSLVAIDSEELAFLGLINTYRAQNGAPALSISYTLTKSVQWKSIDMAVNNYVAHDDLTRTWVQRIRDCGYGYNTWLGENIVVSGPGTAQHAFDQWKGSPAHNGVMLDPHYLGIGVGRYYSATSAWGWYWTIDLGGVADGWPSTPTATPSTTPASTSTASPTATKTQAPTATNTPVPTATNAPAPTATNTSAPTATNTPLPTATNTPAPTATNTSLPTATNTPAPTATNTPQTADATPPFVALTSPFGGGTYHGKVTLAASASDPDGIARVDFYIDGAIVKFDSRAPYNAQWNSRNVAPGAHTVTAHAVDGAGNAADDSVTITVN